MDAAVAPTPALFEDAGDAASLSLGKDITFELHPVGPALIVADVKASSKTAWKQIFIERHLVGGGVTQTDDFSSDHFYQHPSFFREHDAVPGSSYAYRAKLEEKGAWTNEVIVRMATPKAPPLPPSQASAKSDIPYAIDVGWTMDARAAAGVLIETRAPEATTWSRIAILSPTATTFTHGYRSPRTNAQYRVAVFNAFGISPFVETNIVTTPEKLTKALPKLPRSSCTKRPPPHDTSDRLPDAELSESPKVFSTSESPGGGPRTVYGEYQGCLRNLGEFSMQGDTMRTLPYNENGYPVLQGVQGSGIYVGTTIGIFVFANGHYHLVNETSYCGQNPTDLPPENLRTGAQNGDIHTWRGPFTACARDSRP